MTGREVSGASSAPPALAARVRRGASGALAKRGGRRERVRIELGRDKLSEESILYRSRQVTGCMAARCSGHCPASPLGNPTSPRTRQHAPVFHRAQHGFRRA